MSNASKFCLTVVSITAAIWCFLHMSKAGADFLTPLFDGCFAIKDFAYLPSDVTVTEFVHTGVPIFDKYLCFLTPFVSKLMSEFCQSSVL